MFSLYYLLHHFMCFHNLAQSWIYHLSQLIDSQSEIVSSTYLGHLPKYILYVKARQSSISSDISVLLPRCREISIGCQHSNLQRAISILMPSFVRADGY